MLLMLLPMSPARKKNVCTYSIGITGMHRQFDVPKTSSNAITGAHRRRLQARSQGLQERFTGATGENTG